MPAHVPQQDGQYVPLGHDPLRGLRPVGEPLGVDLGVWKRQDVVALAVCKEGAVAASALCR
ncbi:hypothetical protein [Streptomyces sp. 62]|uniref:hypothetical protein n=1 Tax=unclassified Streptomyces TaxID=2593676 RepID=UPI0015F28942